MQIGNLFGNAAVIAYKPLGDKGEDAYAFDFSRPAMHAQAVFDGCGGAGAWKYAEFKSATGAFVAAQCMARYFGDWAQSVSTEIVDVPGTAAQSFHDGADGVVHSLKKECAPMLVNGSLVKSFPCTASAALTTATESGIHVTTLNSGDSRVYAMLPGKGLLQLTRDELRGHPDAMKNLRDSAPLSNLINADKPFTVTEKHYRFGFPCAVMCATDGVFGFFRSPMDFEYRLLQCICCSDSLFKFEDYFRNEVKGITGDDSTCILSFYGWKSWENVKSTFAPRLCFVKGLIDKIDACGEDFSAAESCMEQIWRTYKETTVLVEG